MDNFRSERRSRLPVSNLKRLTSGRRPKPRARRLRVEALERRDLLAGDILHFVPSGNVETGGVSAANEDIVSFEAGSYQLLFDGSDVGLSSLAIDAIDVASEFEILMSFSAGFTVGASYPLPGLGAGVYVDDSDILRFTAASLGSDTSGTFSVLFDGSDVGLSSSGEDIDALQLRPDGNLLVSTTGSFSGIGATGADEDIFLFSATSLGTETDGSFTKYIDGGGIGLGSSSEDIDALAIAEDGRLFLSTTGSFGVSGLSGADEDVFVYDLGTGTFESPLFFDGSDFGFTNDIKAMDLGTQVPSFPSTISFPNFSDPSGLSLFGDAAITPDDVLRLTPAIGGQLGGAWYTAEKQFVAVEWQTDFQFQLTENADPPGGSDGFAFVIQNHDPTYLSGGGGALGYNNLPNSLAIEFDTFNNGNNGDPGDSHISIHTNGLGPNSVNESFSIGSYVTPSLMDDTAVHTVRITYSDDVLSVFLDNLTLPVLSVPLQISSLLELDQARAWVGFTAATGGGWQNHDILNWNYTPLEDISSTISIEDVSLIEGDSGATAMNFTVNRLGDTTGIATVDWTTVSDSATGGTDYVAASGQVTFGDGQTSATIPVLVSGDTDIESHESFTVELSNVSNAILADSTGKGTVLTDDVAISVTDTTVVEGDPGLKFLEEFVANSGELARPRNILRVGNDFIIADKDADAVLRFDGNTGEYVGEFVAAGSSPLDGPWAMAWGPNGNLFVAGQLSNNVLEYDSNGFYVGEFLGAGASGLNSPKGMLFHDGALYISSTTGGGGAAGPHEVLRFRGPSQTDPGYPLPAPGETGAVFVSDGSGGLSNPNGLAIGPDDQLYVASTFTDSVLRYDAITGASLGTFIASQTAGLDGPNALRFEDGLLYVTGQATDRVMRFDSDSGEFVDTIDPTNEGGIDGPIAMEFDSDGNLYVVGGASRNVIHYGPATTAVIQVSLSSASALDVMVAYAANDGPGINDADQGTDFVATSGVLTIPAGTESRAVLVPTVADANPELEEVFTLDLSDPVNGVFDGNESANVTIAERLISIDDPLASEADFGSSFAFVTAATEGTQFNTLTFHDGDLYVAVGADFEGRLNSILRFDASSGASKGVFIPGNQLSGTRDMIFRDGIMYVANLDSDDVKMFDAVTGESLGVFIEAGSDGVDGPDGMFFGPDANGDDHDDLYVAGWNSNNINVYDGLNGTYIDTVVSSINTPHGIALHNGHIFATSQDNRIYEYEIDGTFIRSIGSSADGLNNPIDVAVGPNGQYLYVTSGHTSKVIRYDLNTGAYFDDFGSAADGLDYTRSLTFHEGAVYVTSINNDDVVRLSMQPEAVFTVSVSHPSGVPVAVDFATSDLTANEGSDYVATTGKVVIEPGMLETRFVVPILDDSDYDPNQDQFRVTLTNPSTGSLLKSEGVATIIDDDPAPPGEPPIANAGGPYTATEGVGVALDGSFSSDPDGTVESYAWDFDGDGAYDDATGATPMFTPLSPGVLTVGLRVTDDDGDASTAIATVNVTNVAATADAGGPYSVDEGGVIMLDATTSTEPGSDIVSYEWDFDGDGFDDGTGAVVPYGNSVDGQYTVAVRVTDDGGDTSESSTIVTVDNVGPTADAGGPYSTDVGLTVALTAAGSTDPGNDIASYEWDFNGDSIVDATGVTASYASNTAGDFTISLTVTDDDGESSMTTTTVSVNMVGAGPSLSHGDIETVTSTWQTVSLPTFYDSMVVVATPRYNVGSGPGVARIRNASGNSFQVRVDNAGSSAFSGGVHYVVVEEGVYDEAGFKLEAVKYSETQTSRKNGWGIDLVGYQQTYVSPVVVGQVMTTNDEAWSVFWASSGSRTSPPSSTALNVGKHIAEDPNTTRAPETIGYLVIEATQDGNIEGLPFVAGVGGDTVRGVGNGTYQYSYDAMPNAKTAVLSVAGMDGGDGGWAVLQGINPLPPDDGTIDLAVDEDQLGDPERNHTTEQVAYFVIDPPVPADPMDVNGDSQVTAADALRVINQLARATTLSVVEIEGLDVNRDGLFSALDALVVINQLSRQSAGHANSRIASPEAVDAVFATPDDDEEEHDLVGQLLSDSP